MIDLDFLLGKIIGFKYDLGDGYSIKARDENLKKTKEILTIDTVLKTVIDKKIEDNIGLLEPHSFDKEIVNGVNYNSYKSINLSFGNSQDLEKSITPEIFLNQASLTNVILGSASYASEIIGRLKEIDPNVSGSTIDRSLQDKLSVLRDFYIKEKSFELVACTEIMLNLLDVNHCFKNEEINFNIDLLLSEDVSDFEGYLLKVVEELNSVDIYAKTHKNRFMLATNKVCLINENIEYLDKSLSNSVREVFESIMEINKASSEIRYYTIGDMDFLILGENQISSGSPFVHHYISKQIAYFIDISFSKIKETLSIEGELKNAESKLNSVQNLSLFSSSKIKLMETLMLDISLTYRTKLNICFINQTSATLLLNQDYFSRIGVLLLGDSAVYSIRKMMERNVLNKHLLGSFTKGIERVLFTSDYKVKI